MWSTLYQTHHVGLPGLFNVVSCDNYGGAAGGHQFHQMLPDPVRSHDTHMTHIVEWCTHILTWLWGLDPHQRWARQVSWAEAVATWQQRKKTASSVHHWRTKKMSIKHYQVLWAIIGLKFFHFSDLWAFANRDQRIIREIATSCCTFF